MNDTCYLCNEPKYSVEHTPAKCFFPKENRKDLITVPSCKKHNEDTSKDDEYVRNIICMHVENNNTAFRQFENKVLPSLVRSPALSEFILHNAKSVLVQQQSNIQRTIALAIDRERFDKVMKKIAYALYYNEYGVIWKNGLKVETPCLLHSDIQLNALETRLKTSFFEYKEYLFCEYKKQSCTLNGKNPDIFRYRFEEKDKNGNIILLYMQFYEGFDVFILPEKDKL